MARARDRMKFVRPMWPGALMFLVIGVRGLASPEPLPEGCEPRTVLEAAIISAPLILLGVVLWFGGVGITLDRKRRRVVSWYVLPFIAKEYPLDQLDYVELSSFRRVAGATRYCLNLKGTAKSFDLTSYVRTLGSFESFPECLSFFRYLRRQDEWALRRAEAVARVTGLPLVNRLGGRESDGPDSEAAQAASPRKAEQAPPQPAELPEPPVGVTVKCELGDGTICFEIPGRARDLRTARDLVVCSLLVLVLTLACVSLLSLTDVVPGGLQGALTIFLALCTFGCLLGYATLPSALTMTAVATFCRTCLNQLWEKIVISPESVCAESRMGPRKRRFSARTCEVDSVEIDATRSVAWREMRLKWFYRGPVLRLWCGSKSLAFGFGLPEEQLKWLRDAVRWAMAQVRDAAAREDQDEPSREPIVWPTPPDDTRIGLRADADHASVEIRGGARRSRLWRPLAVSLAASVAFLLGAFYLLGRSAVTGEGLWCLYGLAVLFSTIAPSAVLVRHTSLRRLRESIELSPEELSVSARLGPKVRRFAAQPSEIDCIEIVSGGPFRLGGLARSMLYRGNVLRIASRRRSFLLGFGTSDEDLNWLQEVIRCGVAAADAREREQQAVATRNEAEGKVPSESLVVEVQSRPRQGPGLLVAAKTCGLLMVVAVDILLLVRLWKGRSAAAGLFLFAGVVMAIGMPIAALLWRDEERSRG